MDTMVVMTGQPGPLVPYTHGGVEWEIPVDLLEIQRRFDRADAECARLAGGDDPAAYQAAREQRMEQVLALYRHPWLLDQSAARRRHQADQALKGLARSADA